MGFFAAILMTQAVHVLMLEPFPAMAGPLPVLAGLSGQLPPEFDAARKAAPVSLKRSDALRLVSREYQGPYWSVGPILREVQAFAASHGENGPIFVRFAASPNAGGASAQRFDVGFVATDAHIPISPFKDSIRPVCLVASMELTGRAPSMLSDHRVLREWATTHGYQAGGEILEFYSRESAGVGSTGWQTDIQLVLTEVAAVDAADSASTDPASAETLTTHSAPDASGDVSAAPTDGATSAAAEPVPDIATKTDDLRSADTQPRSSSSATVSAQDQSSGHDAARSAEVLPGHSPVSDSTSPDTVGSIEASHIETGTTSLDSPPREAPKAETLRALMNAGRMEEAALRIVPELSALPPATREWLGQFVLRLNAAARGIRQAAPGFTHASLQLIDAVNARFRRVSSESDLDPSLPPTVSMSDQTSASRHSRRDIMRDLDRLLGGIAVRGVTSEHASDELLRLMERAEAALKFDQASVKIQTE